MGAWGFAIFSDDTACDVRDSYNDVLKSVDNDEAAYRILLQEYKECIESDEASVFWYALALCQWQKGRLTDEVKAKALYYIDNEDKDENLELFKEQGEKSYLKRKEILQQLKQKLHSPQPARKKITPFKTKAFGYKIGDIVAFKFRNYYELFKKEWELYSSLDSYEKLKKNYVAIIVTDIVKKNYGKFTDAYYENMGFAFLNYIDEKMPSVEEIPNSILACNLSSYNMAYKAKSENIPVDALVKIFGYEAATKTIESWLNRKIELEFTTEADTEYFHWLPKERFCLGNKADLASKITEKFQRKGYGKKGTFTNIFNYLLRKNRPDLFINCPLDFPQVPHIKLDLKGVTCWRDIWAYPEMDVWVPEEAKKSLVVMPDDEIILKIE